MNSLPDDLVVPPLARERVHVGCVLTPHEFAINFAGPQFASNAAGYALLANISERALRVVQATNEHYGVRFSAFPALSDRLHCALTLQTGAHQMRMLMSLDDGLTLRWLGDSLAHNRFLVAFGFGETGQAAAASLPFMFQDPEKIRSILRVPQHCTKQIAIDDAAWAVAELLDLSSIASALPGVVVREADVVVAINWDAIPSHDRWPTLASSAPH